MIITVKCYATLQRFQPGSGEEFSLPGGGTVHDVVLALGIAPEEVAVIFVNGLHAPMDKALAEGDRLGLFPAVGGG
ncbi:MoaD/ThiS family protein [Nitratidesulfovibrio sp. SRB-5]|uniref:ThiamineS protein n=1 Tax=Nitratidesulfovibrio vulgaris (strain DSM 19637 / Miyazaki F) TaxID=883 RepID=B8DQ34_NITV9|nr:MoaD/ThiS family protein [Nitratidesulfovibrio sp. SRB-5]MBZ2173443.1 MoaD/ThiS family protein [Nitratidesulfovibrio sp. SRB-5]RXF75980.1 MoaD/ThiS family protein [Desulfovibrio sp. DS-1]